MNQETKSTTIHESKHKNKFSIKIKRIKKGRNQRLFLMLIQEFLRPEKILIFSTLIDSVDESRQLVYNRHIKSGGTL